MRGVHWVIADERVSDAVVHADRQLGERRGVGRTRSNIGRPEGLSAGGLAGAA